MRRFLQRVLALVRPSREERELAREVSAHLQLLEDDFVAKGMPRVEARYAAKRAFGGVEQAKELQRDARAFRWLAGWPMDLKLGARMLVKSPGLTVIAVVALAVAFGAGATYLQFVRGMIHPRIALPGGDRLVGIVVRDLEERAIEHHRLPEFRAWRTGATRIEHLGAAEYIHAEVVTDDGRAVGLNADGVWITATAFRIAPVAPLIGRPLVEDDERPSSPPVAVIGESLWQSVFNRDPNVLGAGLTIGRTRHAIVGVMPKGYGFPINHKLWVPFQDDGAFVKPGEGPPISMFGRLVEGASTEDATRELAVIAAQVRPDDPKRRLAVEPYIMSLQESSDGQALARALYAVNVVFLALLAVCAANVATLVFGRTVTREGEITVRTALGASRSRIVSQLVAEAMVLASLAGIAGLTAARIGLAWVRPAWEQGTGTAMPFWWSERLRPETILYTGLLVVFAALIVGGIPGLKATGRQMQTRLKFAGAGTTMRFGGLWTTIIVTQVAITVVFLLSIVAMAASFMAITEEFENVAFERGHYMTATLESISGTEKGSYVPNEGFLNALRAAQPIESVTYSTRLPGADQESTYFDIDGSTLPVRVAHVGPGFFATFGRRFIAGRDFAMSEITTGANVAIVDESFVRFALGGRAAVGRQVRVKDPTSGELGPFVEIVGVTADMSTAPRKSLRDARLYRPIGATSGQDIVLIAHARAGYRDAGLGAVAAAVRDAARAMPAGRPVRAFGTLAGGTGGDVIEYVFAALGIIGAVALLLAIAGIYALISFTLARRTREIGIRTALGASPRRIVTGILSRAMWQLAIGVAAGAVPGFLIVGSVSSEMGRNGLVEGAIAAGGVCAFVVIVAAISCTVPLRRALGVQPTEALRTT